MEETGDGGVRVRGALGRAPSDTYKISATYMDGYKVRMSRIHTKPRLLCSVSLSLFHRKDVLLSHILEFERRLST